MTIVIEDVYIYVLVAMSIFSVVLCLIRGRGASHKILVCFAALLGTMLLICFGGNAVLSLFGMGWRCTPFNIMLMLCAVFFIAILCCGVWGLIVLKDVNPVMVGCGCISTVLSIVLTLFLTFDYFWLSSWHDGLTTYNDQTIVYSNDQHGGSCDWRYYTHINDLVHGVEILQEDGWIGNPPRNYNQTESN